MVWILNTAHCEGGDGFTMKLLIPQTDAETLALPDRMGKVKHRMRDKFCYAVGGMVVNWDTGGAGT